MAASIVADLAAQLLAIDERIKDIDARVTAMFRAHPQAVIIESLPGMGPILGAELIAAAGDLNGYANPGRLASAAGLVPVPRDSRRPTGNLHRPARYSRKKRNEGDKHVQALICLARRRVDVLWALLRGNRPYELAPPSRKEVPTTP